MNLGGGCCSELRWRHYTLAWQTEEDPLFPKEERKSSKSASHLLHQDSVITVIVLDPRGARKDTVRNVFLRVLVFIVSGQCGTCIVLCKVAFIRCFLNASLTCESQQS